MRRALALCFALASCSRSTAKSEAATSISDDDLRSLMRAGISVSAASTDMSVARAAATPSLPAAQRKIDAILARTVHADCMQSSRSTITDAELSELTRLHWTEVDVDERVKVVHVAALRSKISEPEARRALESLRAELDASADLATFDRVAGPHVRESKGALVLQMLDTFTTDGRATEGTVNSFDKAFVRSAFSLTMDAPLSPISESPFGWHLILLLARHPARHIPEAERRALFEPEAQTNRVHACLSALTKRLRAASSPVMSPGTMREIERIKQSE